MVIKSIITVPATNPRLKGWLIVGDREAKPGEKVTLIPENEFQKLVLEAIERFKNLGALAPYPMPLGIVEWKMNQTTYKWVSKRLEKLREKYHPLLEVIG